MAEIDLMKQEVAAGRNPKDCKVLLAQEIVARFHSQAAAEKALEDFNHRAKGGVPDDIPDTAEQDTETQVPSARGAHRHHSPWASNRRS
jgi:tyrosyl-tRNA synthetase